DWHTGCKALLNTDLTDADRATKVAALMGGVEEKLTRISEDIDNLQGDKDRLQQMKDAAAAADTTRQKEKAFHKSCDNVEEKIALLEADDPAAAATYAAALAQLRAEAKQGFTDQHATAAADLLRDVQGDRDAKRAQAAQQRRTLMTKADELLQQITTL